MHQSKFSRERIKLTTLNVTETDNFEQRLTVENHSVPEQDWVWSSLLSLVPPTVFLFFTVSLLYLSLLGSDRLLDLLPHPKQPIKSNSLVLLLILLLLFLVGESETQTKKKTQTREKLKQRRMKNCEKGRRERAFSDKQRKLHSFVFLIYLS